MKMLAAALALGLSVCVAGAAGATPVAAPAGLNTVLGAHDWINGPATRTSLAGHVVIVDVFTFGCENCKNVTPNLKALDARHVVRIVGIHSPETPYEQDRTAVVASLRTQGIGWPVAVDNDFALWRAYGVTAWPTQLIFDKHGRLRKTVVGDSQDAAVDATVTALETEP